MIELIFFAVTIGFYFISFHLGYVMGMNEPCMREHVPDDEAY